MRLSRGTLTVLSVVVVAGLVVVLGLVVWTRVTTTSLETALGRLPSSVQRASYTDWTAVQDLADGDDVTASSSARQMRAFLDRAFEQDLTTVSALTESFPALADAYGITPLDAEWEIYGQGADGAVNVLRLSDDVDLDGLESRFADLGYEAPSGGAGSDGVWVGSPELVAGLDQPLSPLQENVAVVGAQRLLVTADDPGFVQDTVDVIAGEEDSVRPEDGVEELASVAGDDPVAAVLWVGDFACEDLAMSQADPSEAEDGAELVEAAGGVHPLAGLVMALQPETDLRVGMVFESDEQASDDLQARAELAGGPAPGQGGSFSDRFRLVDATASGPVVTLRLDPVQERVLGDLGQGPVLFASC